MDQFLIENASRFESLVNEFVHPPIDDKIDLASTSVTSDIIICVRIRPLLEEESLRGFRAAIFPRDVESGWTDLYELYNAPRGGPTLKSSKFRLDRAYGANIATDTIYVDVVKDLVPFAWDGGISTLFAYGQTGSGKTFTISRLEELVIESLLNGSLQGPRDIHLTIIELAGNGAFDLLNARKPVSVLEDSFGVTQIQGAQEYVATDTEEATSVVRSANSFRRTVATDRNDHSSRSHAICRIRIENSQDPSAEDGIFYLIDLAGSETAHDRAEHSADRRRETVQINKTLSVLKDCIRCKAEADAMTASGQEKRRSGYVPFRQSTLTKVLKHMFDPTSQRASKTVVMACVNPSNADCGPSRNTLRYAEMLRVLVPTPRSITYRPNVPSTWSNSRLREWIDKNSGDPPIVSRYLAEWESGAQLLKVLELDFEDRCLNTPGVTVAQARSLRSKLWQMHIDSQRPQQSGLERNGRGSNEAGNPIDKSTSRDPDPQSVYVPFKERIRPGMVVRCSTRTSELTSGLSNMVMIMSPATAMGSHVKDVQGNPISGPAEVEDISQELSEEKYLCAAVSPGVMAEAYELSVWRQAVVDVAQMEGEVIMEYDSSTRYYYMAL